MAYWIHMRTFSKEEASVQRNSPTGVHGQLDDVRRARRWVVVLLVTFGVVVVGLVAWIAYTLVLPLAALTRLR